MAERFLAATIPGLIIGSLALYLVDGVPPWTHGMLLIAAGTLAVYDYGRKGGAAKSVKASARLIAAAATMWIATVMVAMAAGTTGALPAHYRFAVAMVAMVVALTAAGVRSGLSVNADSTAARGEGPEAALVIAAALCVGAAGFIDTAPWRTSLLVTSAFLLPVGYIMRPIAHR